MIIKCSICDAKYNYKISSGLSKVLCPKCQRKNRPLHIYKCKFCKKNFKRKWPQKYCSKKCSADSKRKYFDIPSCLKDPTRKIDKNIGYVRIYVPMHPEANNRGYVYEHRIIAEKMIGRSLKKNEVVHHKNRIRWDNRKENLAVMDKRTHSRLHMRDR